MRFSELSVLGIAAIATAAPAYRGSYGGQGDRYEGDDYYNIQPQNGDRTRTCTDASCNGSGNEVSDSGNVRGGSGVLSGVGILSGSANNALDGALDGNDVSVLKRRSGPLRSGVRYGDAGDNFVNYQPQNGDRSRACVGESCNGSGNEVDDTGNVVGGSGLLSGVGVANGALNNALDGALTGNDVSVLGKRSVGTGRGGRGAGDNFVNYEPENGDRSRFCTGASCNGAGNSVSDSGNVRGGSGLASGVGVANGALNNLANGALVGNDVQLLKRNDRAQRYAPVQGDYYNYRPANGDRSRFCTDESCNGSGETVDDSGNVEGGSGVLSGVGVADGALNNLADGAVTGNTVDVASSE